VEYCRVDAALAGLIGTALGVAAGSFTSVLTSWYQLRWEARRAVLTNRAEALRSGRQAMVRLTQLLMSLTQAIAWLGWSVKEKSDEELAREVELYESRSRELLPQILAAETEAASLSDEAFDEIDPLVNELLVLDTKVSTAMLRLGTDRSATAAIAEAWTAAVKLQIDVTGMVRSLLRVR